LIKEKKATHIRHVWSGNLRQITIFLPLATTIAEWGFDSKHRKANSIQLKITGQVNVKIEANLIDQ